jgi:hypothetical protein
MFKCQDCLYLTDRRHNLNRHIKTKHQTRQNELKTSSEGNVKVFEGNVKVFEGNVKDFLDKNCQNEGFVKDKKNFNFENSENFSKKNGKIAKNAENGLSLHSRYICNSCNKEYKTKSYYEKHTQKCNTDNKFQCPFCKKCLSCRQTKSEHLKICPVKESQILVKEHDQTNIQMQNNNNNNTQNVTYIYNIHKPSKRSGKYNDNCSESSDDEEYDIQTINDFGKESISYIPQETMDTLTDQLNVRKLIELKHFNPNHPENHNIRKNNKKSLKVLTEKEWKVQPKDEIFHQIFNRSKNQLFSISLDHRLVNRNNLTDEEIEDVSERWLNYDKVHLKKTIDYITVQFEEILKQRKKQRQVDETDLVTVR